MNDRVLAGTHGGEGTEGHGSLGEQPTHTNHLAKETSPYLLQHAHNPVDWYPWGDEALDLAKSENKPIFLSIGYSACHWCHVMERESFVDADVAGLLNSNFIAIKVDREERPDIDEIYMTAVQLMTGSGGWPLNVFLKPDLEPFFGGTYFPPIDGFGRPGFKTLLSHINSIWRDNPGQVAYSASHLTRAVRNTQTQDPITRDTMDGTILTRAAEEIGKTYDAEWGGFGRAPKFPPSGTIDLLLRLHRKTGEQQYLQMATVTLDRMAYGGMYDHLGGGFHRYSTDHMWLVPHFEKMLYDNALLARVYLDAYQVTGRELYRKTATETLDFVIRDMTDSAGGFFSAIDADSEGEEGRFYVWQPGEIEALLGADDGAFVCDHFGVTAQGNFEGANILHVPKDRAAGEDEDGRLNVLRDLLREDRAKRPSPAIDDKVLTSWNGLTVSALSRGYQVLGENRFLQAAERAGEFLLTKMMLDDTLMHSYHCSDGDRVHTSSRTPAFLDDFAELSNGLLDLYESSFDRRWLDGAASLAERMLADFYDEESGGFFFTSDEHKHLLMRTKPYHDGATPSGNSTATRVLLRLARFLDLPNYRDKAQDVLLAKQEMMSQHPMAFPHLLCATDLFLGTPVEIVIAGRRGAADTENLLSAVFSEYSPNRILTLTDPDGAATFASDDLPHLLAGKRMIEEAATAYVCEDFSCREPVTDGAALAGLLSKRDKALD